MNRTERLYAIAEALRLAGESGRTSQSLAEQFEVSPRTIKRDVLALELSGMPIWSAAGPGGGYRVLPSEATLPPLPFTAGEAAAIAIAFSTETRQPFTPEARSALTKVLSVMGDSERARAEGLAGRVWIRGEPRSIERVAGILDEALRLGRVVAIDYTDASGSHTRARPVDPIAFGRIDDHWYLMAWCRRRDAGRWFRLDRIERAVLTNEPAEVHDPAVAFGDPPADARPVHVDATTTRRDRGERSRINSSGR